MSKKVIILNGPPGCGKDTAVKKIAHAYQHGDNAAFKKLGLLHMKMADPLKKAVHSLFGLFYEPSYYDHDRVAKEQPHPLLFGDSPREAYIKLSEECIKPVYGDDVFGRIACNMMHNKKADVFVYSDGGLVEEWRPVIEWIGAENVLIIEVSATGCNFNNDSRSYVGKQLQAEYPKLQVQSIHNNITSDPFDKELYGHMIVGAVLKFLGVGA